MFTNAAPPTQKGERTRAKILEAALALFQEKGYAATTLRDIAGAAGVSLGLTYRYFASKEELVLALYADVAVQVSVHKLPAGSVGDRFLALMEHKLRVLGPHKDAFGALLAAAVDPASKASVLGDSTAHIRGAMLSAFRAVVAGADDAPADVEALALILYASHLALLLVWVHDNTRGAKRTRELAAMTGRTIALASALPGAGIALQRFAGALAPILKEGRS